MLFSGGLDSAVALWWARAEGHEVVALSYRYHGRPQREVVAARELARAAGVELIEADLPFLREDPALHPASRLHQGAPRGYIPARNAIFYACACYHAEALACDIVVGGHNGADAERFPDAAPAFFHRLERLLHDGLWTPAGTRGPRLVMPLAQRSKLDVVALGRELGVPLALSWSCYEDGELPCGACPSCLERMTLPPLARAGGAE